MNLKFLKIVCFTLLVTLVPVSVMAITLDEAAKKAARQNDAKVLSARTVKQGNSRIHEIKVLTKKGVVKTVRIPEKSNGR
jgi:hypothetical protein